MFWIKIFMVAAWLGAAVPQGALKNAVPAKQVAVHDFKLTDGTVLKGDLASVAPEGFLVKLSIGGFSQRVPWTRLSQETIKKLVDHPEAGVFVRPLVEIPLEEGVRDPRLHPLRPRVQYRAVSQNAELAPEKSDFVSTITMPFYVVIVGLLFAGNLYAGYEVAVYRQRPPALVCGVSLVLPLVGPLIFLSMPDAGQAEADAGVPHMAHEPAAPAAAPAAHGPQSSLNLAKGGHAPTGQGGYPPATYTRNDVDFDRRFFETKFVGFFRVVLGDAEKAVEIKIKTLKNEYIVRRFSRITANELHIQLPQASAGDVNISFGEIVQVTVKAK